jgi:murein DD-endopeptidase MepM/ murein hydrolase activator NlpD
MNLRFPTAFVSMTLILIAAFGVGTASAYEDNEDGDFDDLLTPAYYDADPGSAFREAVNELVHFARLESLHHPLQAGCDDVPAYTVPANGEFGAGKGPGGVGGHHAAVDLHPDSGSTEVPLYAAHGGYVTTYRDAPKYRHYLAITKIIVNDEGAAVGQMVTLYAHIDLDLDEADSLFMDGRFVSKGQLLSQHLYSGTAGGPHLHFEMRLHRTADIGSEVYYGFVGTGLSEPSTGPWVYGLWNPAIGYGFADPRNHGVFDAGVGCGTCPDGVATDKAKLKFTRFGLNGFEKIQIKGIGAFPGNLPTPPLNVASAGMRIEVTDLGASGTVILDHTIPGGQAPNICGSKDGWQGDSSATSQKYRTDTDSVPSACVEGSGRGVSKALVKDMTDRLKGVRHKISGKEGAWGPIVGPLRLVVTYGGTAEAAAGQCTVHSFAPDECALNGSGTSIKCK